MEGSNGLQQKLLMQNQLLESIHTMQIDFLNKGISYGWCDEILKNLLVLSNSEMGFICELLHKEDGTPFIISHGITNIAWNDQTRRFFDEHYKKGLEFHNFNSLWGYVMTSGEPYIANDPDNDPHRGGYPKEDGHPPLKTFMALPIKGTNDEVIGVMGVANRPEGYDLDMAHFLDTFVSTYGILIEKSRAEEQRKKMEDELRAAKEQAEQLAITDAQTDLYNRRYFNATFCREIGRARREKIFLTFGMIDIDDFKMYNDAYGHQVGDDMLSQLGGLLKSTFRRASDFVFRLGGEEFSFLIPRMTLSEAEAIGERIRTEANKLRTHLDENKSCPGISISMGILVVDMTDNQMDFEEIYGLADKALYRAKAEGKNRIVTVTG